MSRVRKPVYRVFGDIGSTREFDNKKSADRWAKSHNGIVIHTGWKLKKVM